MSETNLFAALYQLAGDRLLADDLLTEGQKDRMTELLLNVLYEPKRYCAKQVRDLHAMAKKP